MNPRGIVMTEDRRQWPTTSVKADINSDEYQMGAAGNAISRAQGDALKLCRFSGFNQCCAGFPWSPPGVAYGWGGFLH